MIALVSYGLGNVLAFANIYKSLNVPFCVATTSADLCKADKIILPGVGAFDWAMAKLNQSGMMDALEELVVAHGRPLLGVCVGMQIMAERSDEGSANGLGWLLAEVKRLDLDSSRTMLPHMGWNDVHPRDDDSLFRGLGSGARFYFLHSYHVVPQQEHLVLATTDYHGTFVCAVRHGNIYGVQFHPEKSHEWGIRLLQNFADL